MLGCQQMKKLMCVCVCVCLCLCLCVCVCTWYMMEEGGGSMHGCWSGRGSSSSRSTLDRASSKVTWVVMVTRGHSHCTPVWQTQGERERRSGRREKRERERKSHTEKDSREGEMPEQHDNGRYYGNRLKRSFFIQPKILRASDSEALPTSDIEKMSFRLE